MAQLKTDKNLRLTLSPLHHRTSLQMSLIRHSYFLQHSLVGLQPFIDDSTYAVTIEVLVIVELLETL
jgi:hypothetical protein